MRYVVVQRIVSKLQPFQEKSEMLDDYFSLEISGDGRLVSLPMVFDDHVPSFSALPGCKSLFRNKQYEKIFLFKIYDFDVQTQCFSNLILPALKYFNTLVL